MAITNVQAIGSGANAAATSQAFGSPNTAGNLLLCGVLSNVSVPSPVFDSAGNNWILSVSFSGTNIISLWYALSCVASSANTVSITNGSNTFTSIAIGEFNAGAGNVWAVDGTPQIASGTGLAMSVGMTTSNANDLLVGLMTSNNPSTGVGTGFTTMGSMYSPGAEYSTTEYEIISASGAQTVTGTTTSSGANWNIMAAAFSSIAAPPHPVSASGISILLQLGALTLMPAGGNSWLYMHPELRRGL